MKISLFAAAAALAVATPVVAATPLTVTYIGTVTGTNLNYGDYASNAVFTGVTTEEDGVDGMLSFSSFTTVNDGISRSQTGVTGAFGSDGLFSLFTNTGQTLAAFTFTGGLPSFATNTNYDVTVGGGSLIAGDFGTASISGGKGVLRGSTAVAAVPEPSTWAMMLVGFGAIGGALRSVNRRQKSRAVRA